MTINDLAEDVRCTDWSGVYGLPHDVFLKHRRPEPDWASRSVDYYTCHSDLRAHVGRARTYRCAANGCEETADSWALRHDARRAVETTRTWLRRGKRVTTPVRASNDWRDYMSLCKQHHVAYDAVSR